MEWRLKEEGIQMEMRIMVEMEWREAAAQWRRKIIGRTVISKAES